MTNYFFCTKSHNFHLQAIDHAAGAIHKTALSLVWLKHWPRGPRVNVWESFSATEGYDLGWISSWHIQRAIKVFLMKSLSKQTKSLHTLWPSGPNASPTVALYSNKCKKCTTHTLWLFYQAVIHHKLLCGSCCYYLLLLWCWIHIQDIMRTIQSVDGIWILEPWLQFFDQILRSRDPFSFWWDIEVLFLPTRWNWNSSFRNVCQSVCLLADSEPNAVFHPNHHVWFP